MARPAAMLIPGLLLEVAGIAGIATRKFLPFPTGTTLAIGVGLIVVGVTLQVAGMIRATRKGTPANAGPPGGFTKG